jgi:hypothetical protein
MRTWIACCWCLPESRWPSFGHFFLEMTSILPTSERAGRAGEFSRSTMTNRKQGNIYQIHAMNITKLTSLCINDKNVWLFFMWKSTILLLLGQKSIQASKKSKSSHGMFPRVRGFIWSFQDEKGFQHPSVWQQNTVLLAATCYREKIHFFVELRGFNKWWLAVSGI